MLYRTVSSAAVPMISGQILIDLLIKERTAIYDRAEEGDMQLNRPLFKSVVADLGTGESKVARPRPRWGEMEVMGVRPINDIHPWVERRHGGMGYYSTRFLNAHWYFCEYPHRLGKHLTQECQYRNNPVDAKPAFFLCGK